MKTAHPILLAAALAVLPLAATACRDASISSDPPTPTLRAPALEAAHAAYLDSDTLTMALRIKDVLQDPQADDLAKENARALLEKGYETNGGVMPADWKLPEGFEGISYKQIRASEQDGLRRRIRIDGRTTSPKLIANLTLVKDGETLLDLVTKKGAYYESADDDKMTYFSLESEDLAAFPEPGVFSLRITSSNGKTTDGWFIADRLVSSAAPVFVSPAAGETVTGEHPTIRWEPFRSPEYAKYERRTLSLWLSDRKEDGSYGSPWSSYTGNAGERGEARLGVKGEGGPEVSLGKGDYLFGITYGETRRFGPVRLGRVSRRSQAFHIAE